MLPVNTNIREAYSRGQDAEQNFIQNLAMFLCTFLKEHGSLVEKKGLTEMLLLVSFTKSMQVEFAVLTVKLGLAVTLLHVTLKNSFGGFEAK